MSHAMGATKETSGNVTTDTSGNIVGSNEPSTNSNASTTSKLAGDIKGAVKGVAGSVQAAVGTAIRNEKMADKGFEKMSEGEPTRTATIQSFSAAF
jgi:uncharacterized protein YjbJ (UPF0337 family)